MAKEIITALNNNEFNKRLKEALPKNIVHRDLTYIEGIYEYIMEYPTINLIIIDIDKFEYNKVLEILTKIKNIHSNIQCIICIEKEDIKIRKELGAFGIDKIFLKKEFSIRKVINIINRDDKIRNKELEDEIKKLREIILNTEKNTDPKEKLINIQMIKNKVTSLKMFLEKIIKIKKEKKEEKEKLNTKEKNKKLIKNLKNKYIKDQILKCKKMTIYFE